MHEVLDQARSGRLSICALGFTATFLGWVSYVLGSAWWFESGARECAPYIYAPLLAVGGGILGHGLARRVPARLVAVLLTTVAVWLLAGVLLTVTPGKAPIGYANANAALAVQVVALASLVSLEPRTRRLAWSAVAFALLAVLANRSAAAFVVSIPVVLTASLAVRLSPGRCRWPAALVGIAALMSTTVGLVALARRAAWPQPAVDALDETRRFLWLQAWEAFRGAHITGLGPGAYEALNKFTDPDQTSAHSLPLQVAVELGGIGLGFLVAAYLAGLAVTLGAATPARTWIAAAAWSALAVHSFVDHLLEYWPIPLAAGLVLGYGLVSQPHSEPEDDPV